GAARRGRGGRGARRRRLHHLCARRRTRLRREAPRERAIDPRFDRRRRFAHDLGHFRDDQELPPVEHAMLAEREALRLRAQRQALEDVRDLVDRAAAHLVGVVLEAPFPVLMVVDLAVAELREEPLDFVVADRAPQANAVNVGQRHEHGRVVRDNTKMIETAGGTKNGFFFDALDDPETMIRVNDLVADFECHESPCWKRYMEGLSRTGSSLSIADRMAEINEKWPKNGRFRPFSAGAALERTRLTPTSGHSCGKMPRLFER